MYICTNKHTYVPTYIHTYNEYAVSLPHVVSSPPPAPRAVLVAPAPPSPARAGRRALAAGRRRERPLGGRMSGRQPGRRGASETDVAVQRRGVVLLFARWLVLWSVCRLDGVVYVCVIGLLACSLARLFVLFVCMFDCLLVVDCLLACVRVGSLIA